MNRYLQHLLADIRAAHQQEETHQRDETESFESQISDIDRLVSGDGEQNLGYFCGLKPENFPPSEQLEDEEIKQVCKAFTKMLQSWGGDIHLPDNLPLNKRYELTVSLLNRGFTPLNFGVMVFDFCTGNAPDCELESYCPCLKNWSETT